MKLIIANWKSNKSWSEAQEWLHTFSKNNSLLDPDLSVAIAPPLPLVGLVASELDKLKLSAIQLATQDLSPFPPGSYTGATSSKNLEGLNVKVAILGHSERRHYFHETSQQIANKVEQALSAGIQPVVCMDQPDISSQMVAIDESFWSKIIVAYEPAGAIGSGNQEPLSEVQKVTQVFQEKYQVKSVLYGGSVSAGNVAEYLSVTQGAIVATHSLDVTDFITLLQAAV